MHPHRDMLCYHLHYILFLKITVTVVVKVGGTFLLISSTLNLAIACFFSPELLQAFLLGKSNCQCALKRAGVDTDLLA